MGIPFVVRSVEPVLAKLDGSYEEAGAVLGANNFTIFRRIILPEILPAGLAGFALAFARGLGEYGSVIYISGNSAKAQTQVVSYVIMQNSIMWIMRGQLPWRWCSSYWPFNFAYRELDAASSGTAVRRSII